MQNASSIKKSSAAGQVAESAFDSLYLTASLALAIGLFATGRTLWGTAVAILFAGDSLHLIPRIYRFATNRETEAERLGKIAASVTMTLFYVAIWWYAATLTEVNAVAVTAVIALAAVRIALCFVPHSFSDLEPPFAGMLRNVPFIALGAIAATEFGIASQTVPAALWVSLCIAASFAFYIPVILLSGKIKKIGILMLPKSCAYLAIAALGFAL